MADLASSIDIGVCINSPSSSEKQLIEKKKEFMDSFFSLLLEHISAGDEVHIKNFGKFSLRQTKESVRNPANNNLVLVDRRKRIKF
jgi:nucleoid DNA-binding protein